MQTLGSGADAAVFPTRSLPGLRVLLVDDNVTVLKMLEHMVNSWGIHADTALSGKEALALIRSTHRPRFDVAILDLAMPEMDGIELALALREDPATAPLHLLMLTSFRGSATQELFRETGVERCLSKPVRHTQLFDCIASLTGMASEKGTEEPCQHDTALVVPISANILLVEDNPVNQEVGAAILEILGSRVTVVGNGVEALEQWSHGNYDLVLMDCQMPVMDGYQATGCIRERERSATTVDAPAHIPVIALTADAIGGTRERCLAAGMDDYLTKPFTKETLRAALDRWLPHDAAKMPDIFTPEQAAPIPGELMRHLARQTETAT